MHRSQLFCHNQGIYLNKYMHLLFYEGGSCRIETSLLICSETKTGFCIIEFSIVKDSRRSSSTYNESLFSHVVSHNLLFFFSFFFYLAFFSRILSIHRTVGEGGDYLLVSFLPLPPPSQVLIH